MALAEDHLAEPDAAPAAGAGDAVVLKDRYEVQPSQPLPDLATPTAQAFAARDSRDPTRPLFALVCHTGLPPREHLLEQRRKRSTNTVLQPLHWEPVRWPALGRECMVIILDRPTGKRLLESIDIPFKPYTIDRLIREVLRPIVPGLKESDELRVPHRAIRPDNLYLGHSGVGSLVLGECYSTPAGFTQPVLFEPIERACAPPAGRGEGTSADDMYALGVTLVVLVLGGNPMAEKSDDEIIREKISRGSHGVLVGATSVPAKVAPALRGLLSDDPEARWSVHELERWLEGSPPMPRGTGASSADRPFPFMGEEYHTAQTLALALHRHWDAAIDVVNSDALETWLMRSLDKGQKAEAFKTIGHGDRGARKVSDDMLLARALIVLDPSGPIRFRDFVAMPDGFGPAVAAIPDGSKQAAHFAAMIEGKLPAFWLKLQKAVRAWMIDACEPLHQYRKFMSHKSAGFYVERCLYELNPTLPCRSPHLAGLYATDRQGLLALLEARTEGEENPVDRHVAAFLGARFRGKADRILNELAAARGDTAHAAAAMRLLALVQGSMGAALPCLSRVYFERLRGGLTQFRNRTLRKELEQDLAIASERGNLAEMLAIFENPRNIRLDASGFKAARAEFRRASVEIENLHRAVENRARLAQLLGHRVAAYLCSAVGTMAIVITVLAKLS